MCGFVGICNRETPVDRDALVRMRDQLVHRGPDEEGLHVDGSVGLGFRRLSIMIYKRLGLFRFAAYLFNPMRPRGFRPSVVS